MDAISLPPIPPLKYKTRFSYPEGSQFEFKASGKHIQKMYETICAFLNTGGGYFLIGINDSGIIDGIPFVDVDPILLNVDNIIHQNRIANFKTEDTITNSEISSKTFQVSPERYVVCIIVTPQTSDLYILKTSEHRESFFRLNASNIRTKTSIDVARFDYEERLTKARDELNVERNAHTALVFDMHKLTKQLKSVQKQVDDATFVAKSVREEAKSEREDAEVVLAMLHAHILENKEMWERELELKKSSESVWWWPF